MDPDKDYSKEASTLVEFRLEKTANGTLLVLTESGFDKLPGDRRDEALRKNDGGWTAQMKNIENYVTKNP
ncbi:MAG: SRPBCC domain-containing protein [Candidatus Acidiferrum sp.]